MNIKQLNNKLANMQKVLNRLSIIVDYNNKLIDIANYKIDRKQIAYMNKIETRFDFIDNAILDLKEKIHKQQTFITDWNNITLLKMFEIEVYNEISKEDDHIIYDIHLDLNNMTFWTHSIDSENPVEIEIDLDYSIDSNLEEFYDACIIDIIEADDYNLRY